MVKENEEFHGLVITLYLHIMLFVVYNCDDIFFMKKKWSGYKPDWPDRVVGPCPSLHYIVNLASYLTTCNRLFRLHHCQLSGTHDPFERGLGDNTSFYPLNLCGTCHVFHVVSNS